LLFRSGEYERKGGMRGEKKSQRKGGQESGKKITDSETYNF